jgi:hypothetical protein
MEMSMTRQKSLEGKLCRAARLGLRLRVTWHPDAEHVSGLTLSPMTTPDIDVPRRVSEDKWLMSTGGWIFILGEPKTALPSVIGVEILDEPQHLQKPPIQHEWHVLQCNNAVHAAQKVWEHALAGWQIGRPTMDTEDPIRWWVPLCKPLT